MFTLFFVAPEELVNDTIELTGAQAHHAISVLRVQKDEILRIADGQGNWVEGPITNLRKDALVIDVRRRGADINPKVEIAVAQALLKGDNQKSAIDQLVQAGVSRIIPWHAQRSVGTVDKSEKWLESIVSAARQSRRSQLPELEPVTDLKSLIESCSRYDLVIALHEGATKKLSDLLPLSHLRKVLLIVGPEGGMSNEEIELIKGADLEPVQMGETVIRADLAGALALAALNALTGTW